MGCPKEIVATFTKPKHDGQLGISLLLEIALWNGFKLNSLSQSKHLAFVALPCTSIILSLSTPDL